MSNDLSRLETWAAPLLAKMSATERRKLNQSIARDLRRSQQQRIRAQRNPDGSRFAPRKKAKPVKTVNKPKSFIYRGKERLLISYQNQGKAFTGYDRKSGGIRTFVDDRVEKWLTPPKSTGGGGTLRSKRGKIKRAAMFGRIAQAKRLRLSSTPDYIALAFMAGNAKVARVHQYGLRDKPSPKQKDVQYSRRELLGFSPADLKLIEDKLIEHLTRA